jgi:hypothetical protein
MFDTGVFITFEYCEESFCSAYYLEGDSSLTEDPTEGALSYALTGRVVNPLKVGGPASFVIRSFNFFLKKSQKIAFPKNRKIK